MAAKNYYQGCLLANCEANCYYFFCEKRGNCEQFKQFQKEKERIKNGESETKWKATYWKLDLKGVIKLWEKIE